MNRQTALFRMALGVWFRVLWSGYLFIFYKFLSLFVFVFGCVGSLLLRTGFLIVVASLAGEHGL